MTRSFSIYLDFIRFLAAFMVLLAHSTLTYTNPHWWIFRWGHEAVIIFFVLSGFVIAYVADAKEKTLKDYTVSRLARIYSVVVPAIILTLVLDLVGQEVKASAYAQGYTAWDWPLVRLLVSLFFLNEFWGYSIQLFSNVPFWSLSYEVSYYVAFGVLAFSPPRWRWLLFGLLCLVIGYKILLLMPLWWAGYWAYKSEFFKRIGVPLSVLAVIVSVVGIWLYKEIEFYDYTRAWMTDWWGANFKDYLSFSSWFITDYFVGAMVFLHFVGMRNLLEHAPAFFDWCARPVRSLAGATFSIYLFHMPLLFLIAALIDFEGVRDEAWRYWLIVVLTTMTAIALSYVTERRKHVWKPMFSRLYDRAETLVLARARARQGG